MIDFECIVQEGVIAADLRPGLTTGLVAVCTSLLGEPAESVRVSFTEVPEGSGFKGGEPSRTSLVMGTIPPGCESQLRTQLLKDIEDMWRRTTGCAVDEVVVAATDHPN